MNPPNVEDSIREAYIKKELFTNAMKSNWKKVIELYKSNPEAQNAKITRSGDTALHIAISDGQESTVEELVEMVKDEALKIENEVGNTPLHLAAYLGNSKMCSCIADRDPKLMGIRNQDKETPLFLAVLHGRKDAFHCLNALCKKSPERYGCSRGKDGDTILHSAIDGEYLEIAFHIIHDYENLLNLVNEKGLSPLHILASKPSAFRSGSHIRGFHQLIYHCIFVDEINLDVSDPLGEGLEYDHNHPKYPQNYQTCVGLFLLTKNLLRVLMGLSGNQHDKESPESDDPENCSAFFNFFKFLRRSGQKMNNPEEGQQPAGDKNEQEHGSEKMKNQEKGPGDKNEQVGRSGNQHDEESRESAVHKNCSTFFNFVKFLRKAMLVPEGSAAGSAKVVPENCSTCFNFVKFLSKAMLVILGLGSSRVESIREKKTKHVRSVQIMRKLIEHASSYEYEYKGERPDPTSAPVQTPAFDFTLSHVFDQKDVEDNPSSSQNSNENGKNGEAPEVDSKKESASLIAEKYGIKEMVGEILGRFSVAINDVNTDKKNIVLLAIENRQNGKAPEVDNKKESALLIAAKNGIKEMVEEILEKFPVAINDTNTDKKNIVLLAVENRQPHIYKFLKDRKIMKETIFRETDKDGNSALHLAAMMGDHRPWLIPGAALQMQWEIKWYEYVKKSMPINYFVRHNNQGQTPLEIFNKDHLKLVGDAGTWLKDTSQSCSVVAALIATVAFATSATVPGGVTEGRGTPTLQNEAAFSIFALSSLVALCFSVTSVVMFLAILTSRYQEKDFGKGLPNMLLFGLTSLFVSIGSMLLSFCAGHFFVLKENLKYAAFPMYAVTCFPVTLFAIAQFRLYIDLFKATIRSLPQRRCK